MKKVGILTFHDAHNYGAILQVCMLKKYITQLGYDVKVINYHNQQIPNKYVKKGREEFDKEEFHKYAYFDHWTRWEKINQFINELTDYAQEVYTSEKKLEGLDIDYWICGSDQIWNTDLTKGIDRGFFLDFKTNGKKIAYAASMGKDYLDEHEEAEFKRLINGLDCISVREETLKEYAERFTDKEIKKVLDPTLLLNPEEYADIIENIPVVGNYLVVFSLITDDRLRQVALEVAKQKNLEIIEINECKLSNYYCRQVSNAGLGEFLSLIKNASAVVTNSFHGTVFSILFKKDFYTLTNLRNRNARVENILNIVGMRDRLIDGVDALANIKEQDFEKAFENLDKAREESKNYIKKALDYVGD